jgi:hypothetical protein
MGDIQAVLAPLLADDAIVRAGASAALAFLFVQAIKIWPAAKSPDWRPRAIAIGTALAINLLSEYVQVEQTGMVPLWGRAMLLGFASGVAIVVLYPLVKGIAARGSGRE